jgi:hypothetical protein
MPKYACNVCKTDYPDSPSLLKHFTKEHSTTRCILCSREAAEKGSYCPTCRKAFANEIANLESERELKAKIEDSLKQLDTKIYRHAFLLRDRFLQRRAELFCPHNLPKEQECAKCEVRPVNKSIIRVDISDFKPAMLKKPVIRVVL